MRQIRGRKAGFSLMRGKKRCGDATAASLLRPLLLHRATLVVLFAHG